MIRSTPKPVFVKMFRWVTILILLFLAINLVLGAGFWMKDFWAQTRKTPADATKIQQGPPFFAPDGAPLDNGKRNAYQLTWFDYSTCRELGESFVAEVLDDFYELGRLGRTYQPWVQFSEAPFRGKRVHVDTDELGFPIRRTLNPEKGDPTAPLVRIFIFGGHTTFGYYVSDEHTWPTFLSRILNERVERTHQHLRVEIINYGRAFYNPSQESVLLMDLLKSGHRPSLVLFMDGVKMGPKPDIPKFTVEAEQAFHPRVNKSKCTPSVWRQVLHKVPLVRLVRSVKARLGKRTAPQTPTRVKAFPSGPVPPTDIQPEERDEVTDRIVMRFEQNRKLAESLCDLYGCQSLFFLQPNAKVNYDLSLYRQPLSERYFRWREDARLFYAKMKAREGFADHTIDLSHLFSVWGVKRKAILDEIDYSPAFNQFLAERVAASIDLESLPVFPQAVDSSQATGHPRKDADLKQEV